MKDKKDDLCYWVVNIYFKTKRSWKDIIKINDYLLLDLSGGNPKKKKKKTNTNIKL
jgi:hypothetical protein